MIIKDTLVLRRSRFWLVGWVGWNRDNSWFLRIQEMEVTRIMLKKKKSDDGQEYLWRGLEGPIYPTG